MRHRFRHKLKGFAGLVRRKPVCRLVVHSLRRMMRAGADQSAGDVELGAGPLLGLLIAPGAFQCLLSLDKYSSLMNFFRSRAAQDLLVTSMPDKLLFIAISMAMTGLLCVLRWDRLLLDSQDFVNLAPLPVRRGTILIANVTAIAVAAAVISIAVNAASFLLFPALVSAAAPDGSIHMSRFLMAHVVAVCGGSLFAFVLVIAVLCTCELVTPPSLAAAPVVARAVLLVGFLLLIPASIMIGDLVRLRAGVETLTWFPPLWFLDLYQRLQSRGPAGAADLSPTAWKATCALLGVATASCGLLYARRFTAAPARSNARASSLLTRWTLDALRLTSPADSLERAVREFTLLGLLRHDPQRLIVMCGLGLGWLIAVESIGRFPASPLIPAFLLVLALSVAVRMPAALPANWSFRVILSGAARPVNTAVQQVGALLLAGFVLMPAAALWVMNGRSWGQTAVLMVVVGTSGWIHIQLVFRRQGHIPFTRPFEPFRQSLPVKCLLQALAFAAVVWSGWQLYPHFLARPAYACIPVTVALGLQLWGSKNVRVVDDPENRLSFEPAADDAVQTLGLR